MKTRIAFTFIMIFGFLSTTCIAQRNLINAQFPKAEKEVLETFGAIAQSIKDGDIDKLISFHAYGPKFTEFKNG
ncbi:hypothetical protein [Changchengzhania lutea]|uniref:hypothetical protein n=1 Tax=Changchengzhania lutea TaxID=2049305 RepID=UPI001FE50976|nr:hypothetical protein [Changchengzhania lutea]